YEGKPYFSALTVIGGLSPKGYIQVVTNPVHHLRYIEKELGMPASIRLPDDTIVFQSDNWPTSNSEHQVLKARDLIKTSLSETALSIEVANPVEGLLNKLARTRLMIIMIALLVTLITVWIVMGMLQRTTVNPLRSLTRQLRLVRKDKTHLGEQVSVEGNMEVRELANDFNEMTGELKELYTALNDMAFTDSLTDLPNRALFQDRIEQLTELSKREGRKFCVMMMDLDRFKEVNDTLGHEYGDKLLQVVSERLTTALRKSDTISLVKDDTVARLGGDEFAALLPTTQTADGGMVVARKITDLMTAPFSIDDHTFSIGISIGISMFPHDGEDATTLIRHADIAMYHAKKSQKGYAFYNADLDKHSLDNLTLGNQLRESIQNDKLDLHFQPKIDFNSGRICGAEALVRWQHPERGFIPPDQFVALAEKIGLIQPLTLWVLNRSLEECARWNKQDLPLSIAVNLSALSLHDATTTGIINDALNDWKLPPSLLSLELTESAMMNDPQLAMEILAELGSKGINISVDDFGTGYSSLTYLKRLPVNEIKIDRSFVMDMFSNQQDEAIVKSTIDLAHNMKLKVIAEGIEDNITYQKLKNMGCDMGQGFYMGRPVNKQDLAEWLKISPWGLKSKPK
ncbi:MAG: EAL domain-containing protein, partial [Gammaproteobacteria bacterium]|nr:EAL domain-containing protein [Gammaproteobacteria bacterium]